MPLRDSFGIRILVTIQMEMVDTGLQILTGHLHLDSRKKLTAVFIRMLRLHIQNRLETVLKYQHMIQHLMMQVLLQQHL